MGKYLVSWMEKMMALPTEKPMEMLLGGTMEMEMVLMKGKMMGIRMEC